MIGQGLFGLLGGMIELRILGEEILKEEKMRGLILGGEKKGVVELHGGK